MIALYTTFKAGLLGFIEVSFEEFRGQILPLRKQSVWSEEEVEYIRSLLNGGAGFALQRLYGMKNPAALAVLGTASIEPEPLSKAELDKHMRALTSNCLRDNWPPQRFIAFASYLDSNLTPKQLMEREREERETALAFERGSSLFVTVTKAAKAATAASEAAAVATAASEAAAVATAATTPKTDQFATMYRRAGPAFKSIVNEHLALAAEKAHKP